MSAEGESSVQPDMQIVRAEARDAAKLAPIFDAYRQFYRQPTDVPGAEQFLRRRLERGESVIYFIEDADGQVIGFTQLYPCFSSTSMKPLWILNDLFVVQDARKHGVATMLLERARQLAVETDAESLMLETAIDNLRAQRLYEALGWKRDNEFHRYYLRVSSGTA